MRLARGSPPLTRISASGAAIRLIFFNALLSKLLAWKRKNPKKRGEGGSISFWMAGFTTRLYFDVSLCAASYVFNVSSSSVLFYAQIQCVYDRFKNTSSGLAVTAPSLAIAWFKVISCETIALDKASRQVKAVCRTPYPISWQWFNKMWADLDNPDAFAPAVAQISIAVTNFLPTRKHLKKACFILKVEHIAIADAPIGPFILFLNFWNVSHHWRGIETRARTCVCLGAEA